MLLNNEVPQVAEGVWGAITATPEPIRNGSEAELIQDNSKTQWYGTGTKDAEQGLLTGLQKSLGQLVKLEIPAPGTPNPPHLVSGGNPNKGDFTIKWKPAPTLRARFHPPAQEPRRHVDDRRHEPQQARIHLQTGVRRHLELPRQGEQRNRRKRLLG